MKNYGFTLVELMITIAIIGILSIALFPAFSGYFERSRSASRKAKFDNVQKEFMIMSSEKDFILGDWTFDDNDYLYDRGGRGNNLVQNNSPISGLGRLGKSLHYNGVNQYLSTNIFNTIDLGNTNFSLSLWINTQSNPTTEGLLKKGVGPFNAGGIGMELRRNMNGLEFCVWGGVGVCPRILYSMPVGDWRHIAITHNRATGLTHMYIDAIEVASGTLLTTPYTDVYPLYIGRGQDGYFNGDIDNVSIYSDVLSSQDVKKIYESSK